MFLKVIRPRANINLKDLLHDRNRSKVQVRGQKYINLKYLLYYFSYLYLQNHSDVSSQGHHQQK